MQEVVHQQRLKISGDTNTTKCSVHPPSKFNLTKSKSKPMFLTQASHSQPASHQPPTTNHQPPTTQPQPPQHVTQGGGECFLLANGPFWGVPAPIYGWGAPFSHKISTVLRRTWPQKGTPKSSFRYCLTRCTPIFLACAKGHHENIGA